MKSDVGSCETNVQSSVKDQRKRAAFRFLERSLPMFSSSGTAGNVKYGQRKVFVLSSMERD